MEWIWSTEWCNRIEDVIRVDDSYTKRRLMMTKTVQRGYYPSDEKDFCHEAVQKLGRAGCDLYYLLNQGYQIKGASVFVGNHYLLSER